MPIVELLVLHVCHARHRLWIEEQLGVVLALAERQHATAWMVRAIIAAHSVLEVRRASKLIVEVAFVAEQNRPVQVEIGPTGHQATRLLVERLHQVTHVVHVGTEVQLIHVIVEVVLVLRLWDGLVCSSRTIPGCNHVGILGGRRVNWIAVHVVSGQNRFHAEGDLGIQVLVRAVDHFDLLLLLIGGHVRLMEHIDAQGLLGRSRLLCVLTSAVHRSSIADQVVWSVRFLRLGPIVDGFAPRETWRVHICTRGRELIRCTFRVLPLRHELRIQPGLSLALALQDPPLLLGLLLQFGQVVLVGFPLRIFIQLCDHLVVISALLSFLGGLLDEVLVDDRDKLIVSLIQHLWCHLRHVWLVQQEPVRVLAFEDGEVAVEKGAVRLEFILAGDLLLDVVRCVDQVVQDLLLDGLWVFFLSLADNLSELVLGAEARPEDQLKLAEHQELPTELHVNTKL